LRTSLPSCFFSLLQQTGAYEHYSPSSALLVFFFSQNELQEAKDEKDTLGEEVRALTAEVRERERGGGGGIFSSFPNDGFVLLF
jgi:hypothetical protein